MCILCQFNCIYFLYILNTWTQNKNKTSFLLPYSTYSYIQRDIIRGFFHEYNNSLFSCIESLTHPEWGLFLHMVRYIYIHTVHRRVLIVLFSRMKQTWCCLFLIFGSFICVFPHCIWKRKICYSKIQNK